MPVMASWLTGIQDSHNASSSLILHVLPLFHVLRQLDIIAWVFTIPDALVGLLGFLTPPGAIGGDGRWEAAGRSDDEQEEVCGGGDGVEEGELEGFVVMEGTTLRGLTAEPSM